MINCDEDPCVYNGQYEVEVTIDRPSSHVWNPLLDDSLWVTSHTIERVCGDLGTLGFITRVGFKNAKEAGAPSPHYHYCKVIKLVPERQLVLKTYSEEGGSYGMQMTAFDDTRLIPLGDRTKVIFNIYFEGKSEDIAKNPTSINMNQSREGMLANLNNLKRIVEGR